MRTLIRSIVPRVLAFAVGGFTLINLLGEYLQPGFDASIWWIDLRPLSPLVAYSLLLTASILFLGHALSPARHATWRARLTLTSLLVLAVFVFWNCVHFFELQILRTISAGFPLPFSLVVLAALAWIGWSIGRAELTATRLPGRRAIVALAALAVLAAGFPLGQMCCFGKTDYRRPADAIVVFGAGVNPSGHPSDALKDRVRTACVLYHEGLARKLIFSGGPGMGEIHETEAMRRFATTLKDHAVPDDAILVDASGVNTRATVQNTCRLFREHGFGRVLAVSHFYHLPRVKMAYQRAGHDVYTVPAKESYTLTMLPWYIAREVAALWLYYIRPPVRNG